MTFLDVLMENWWSLIIASLFLVIGIFLLIVINSKKYSDSLKLENAKTTDNSQINQQKSEVVQKSNPSIVKSEEGTKNAVVKEKEQIASPKEQVKEVKKQNKTENNTVSLKNGLSQSNAENGKNEVLFADSKRETKKSTAKKPTAKKTAMKKSTAKKSENNKKIGEKTVQVQNEEVTENYRLTYDKVEKNWVLKKDGAKKATKRFKTKEEATEYAKNISEKHDANLAVHKKDGKFQKKSNI